VLLKSKKLFLHHESARVYGITFGETLSTTHLIPVPLMYGVVVSEVSMVLKVVVDSSEFNAEKSCSYNSELPLLPWIWYGN